MKEEYLNLLVVAGIHSIPALAESDPKELHKTLSLINSEASLVEKIPELNLIQEWIDQANTSAIVNA